MADRSCSGTISEKIALLFVPDLPAAHVSELAADKLCPLCTCWGRQRRARRPRLRPAPATMQSSRGLGTGAPACARVGLMFAHQLMHAPMKKRTAAYLLKLSPVAVIGMSCARARAA
jgi:hypothetical protein